MVPVRAEGLGGEKPTFFTPDFLLIFVGDAAGKPARLVMVKLLFGLEVLKYDEL